MRATLWTLLSLWLVCAFAPPVLAHGANFPPPSGDGTPPPSGGGGGSGGGSGGGFTPGAPAVTEGGLPAPTSPNSGPSRPSSPVGGGALPRGGGPTAAPSSGGGALASDLTGWHYWWHFNQEPYLRLRERLYRSRPRSDGAEHFLGRGAEDEEPIDLRPREHEVHEEVVPALARALEKERSNHVVSAALIALARIGDRPGWSGEGASPMARLIQARLADPNQEIQETAALSLGILSNEANVFLLAQLLESDREALGSLDVELGGSVPHRTRAFAAYALGLIGSRASVPARAEIVRLLALRLDAELGQPARADLCVALVTALGMTPLPARAPLIADGAGTGSRARALQASYAPDRLRRLEDQIAWLMDVFEDDLSEKLVRAHVPIAVARLCEHLPPGSTLREETGLAFLRGLAPRVQIDPRIRQSCAMALGRLADADADTFDAAVRTGLRRAVEELADRQTRFFAILSLAQIAGRPGQGAGDPLAALSGPRNVRAFLLGQLARGRSGTQTWAGLGLGVLEHALASAGHLGSTDVHSALRTALFETRSPEEIGAYAIATGLCRGPASSKALARKLASTSDPDARVYLATGLGLAGEWGAREALREQMLASMYRPALLQSSAVALALIGELDASRDLIEMLGTARSLSAESSICRSLGFIGDRRAIGPLLAFVDDRSRTDLARAFAVVALGIVGDRDLLPWGSRLSVHANYRAVTATFYDPGGTTGVLNLL